METTKCSNPKHTLNSQLLREQSLNENGDVGLHRFSYLVFLLWWLHKMHLKSTFDRIKGITYYIQ